MHGRVNSGNNEPSNMRRYVLSPPPGFIDSLFRGNS